MTRASRQSANAARPQQHFVPYVSVENMLAIIRSVSIERFICELAAYIEADFKRWAEFDKCARVASHSPHGVIELMPASDGELYSYKYVNGHPQNADSGLQTVAAFGVLALVETGYPILVSE